MLTVIICVFGKCLIAAFFLEKKAAERKLSKPKRPAQTRQASASTRFQWSILDESSSALQFTEIAKRVWTASPPAIGFEG